MGELKYRMCVSKLAKAGRRGTEHSPGRWLVERSLGQGSHQLVRSFGACSAGLTFQSRSIEALLRKCTSRLLKSRNSRFLCKYLGSQVEVREGPLETLQAALSLRER